MLTVYFDDGGNEQVAAVAGYLGSTFMWETFDKRWANLLKQYDIPQMHRTDLESFWGDFKGWTPERRTEFVIKANAIIRDCTYLPIGTAIIKNDFNASFPVDHVANKFGLYSWCIHACLASLGKWCKAHTHREPINFVFEAGTDGRDQVDKTFAHLYNHPEIRPPDACPIRSWSFAGKDVQPLQAADVVAYELFKLVQNYGIEGGKRRLRASARGLFKEPVDVNYLNWFDKRAFDALKGENIPGWGEI